MTGLVPVVHADPREADGGEEDRRLRRDCRAPATWVAGTGPGHDGVEALAGREAAPKSYAAALSLKERILAKICVTRSSSKTWSGPVGATSVNGVS